MCYSIPYMPILGISQINLTLFESLKTASYTLYADKPAVVATDAFIPRRLSVKKMRAFLYFRSLRFAYSLGLTSFSSFSLADRIQASLILARSCVSCTIFNLLRSLKVLSLTEKYPNKFGISFVYSYLCRQLTASEPLQRLGFTGIRCESGTVPAAVSPFATVCLLHS